MTGVLAPTISRSTVSAIRPIAVVLVCLMFCIGCVGPESIFREVSVSRTKAYHAWRRMHEQEDSQVSLGGRLNLADALKLALVNNKALQAASQSTDIARGRAMELRSNALPKLTAIGNYTRYDDVVTFDVGGQSLAVGATNNYSVDLEVRQPIYHGGAIRAAARAAAVVTCLSDVHIRGQVQQTVYQVAKAYNNMLLAQHLYKVNEDAVKSALSHLKDVKAKLRQGTASKYDVLRAEVDASNFEAEMIRQRNRIHLARTQLFKAMGVSQDGRITLSDELTYRPIKPVLVEAARVAYERRPDLHRAELDIRLQEQAVRLAKSRFWPEIDGVLTQRWGRPDPYSSTRDDWGGQTQAGISIKLPIFDGYQNKGRLVRERAALRQKEFQLLDAQERALLEIRQALLSLHNAEELVESQKLNLKRAAEGLRLAGVNYREGISTEVAVIDARAALTRTKGIYYQSIYAHVMARLALDRAMGVLGPRDEEADVEEKPEVRPAPDPNRAKQPEPSKSEE
jgi:outer membrane protein